MMADATTCTCPEGPRCPEGNALWEAANAVYHSRGHDAWEVALSDYREHVQAARQDALLAKHFPWLYDGADFDSEVTS